MGLFAQLAMLGSGGMLVTGLILLWRRGVPAYIRAFRWQSYLLAGLSGVVAHFGDVPELYGVAVLVLALKGVAIPRLLDSMERRFRSEREIRPYLNAETSLMASGLLVLFGYTVSRPITAAIALPTRAGLPLAMGLLFVALFVIVSRKKAITQVIGFLMMENAIALLAVLGTYGIPLIVELGVFLDLLMGFLVMQIFVYDIHETFQTIDVEQLNRLRH